MQASEFFGKYEEVANSLTTALDTDIDCVLKDWRGGYIAGTEAAATIIDMLAPKLVAMDRMMQADVDWEEVSE